MSTASIIEIFSARVFKCTLEQLFQSFSNAEKLKKWWGPKGFTNSFHEFDLREGGTWRFTMHGPEKGNYENAAVFRKIIPNHLISWTRQSQPLFDMELHFEEIDAQRSRLSFKMFFKSEEEASKLRRFVLPNNEENFDRLERLLADAHSSTSTSKSNTEIAKQFLKLTASGNARKAYDLYVAQNFTHHNPFFKGDRESLLLAMEENAISHPNKTFETLRVFEDGNLIACHSRVEMDSLEVAVVHIFRFEGDKIAELWDIGQVAPAEKINQYGMF